MRQLFASLDCCDKSPLEVRRLRRWPTLIVAVFLLTTGRPTQAQSGAAFPQGVPLLSPGTKSEQSCIAACNPVDIQRGSPALSLGSSGMLDSFDQRRSVYPQSCCTNFGQPSDGGYYRSWFRSEQNVSLGTAAPFELAEQDTPEQASKASSLVTLQHHERPDFNRDIYYRNRLEFGLDVGWHPVNIPFIYDFAVGDSYNMTPLKYTLVPIIASLRWHVTNVGWRWIFRGNMDFTFSGSITPIPRGPETHYYAFMFGIRRNFVYRNWRLVPFFEQRGGAGMIDAKEPLGVLWAQGQNLTFTYNMGAGVRYNLNSKYSFSGGMNYMHISNGYLSEPQFVNYGINVYGPMFGMDVRLGKAHHRTPE
jgi:Lipid A 3-O-deacylase (PagL)